MLVVPGETPRTRPVFPPTVATLGVDEVHVAVTDPVLPSLKVPVAIICKVAPTLTKVLPLLAPMVIEVSVGLTKKPLQPARNNVTTPARYFAQFDRPRFDIPHNLQRRSYQTRIQLEGGRV